MAVGGQWRQCRRRPWAMVKYRLNYIECLALATGECTIFALTAWLALAGMWAGAGIMDRLRAEPVHAVQLSTQEALVVMPVAP